MTAACQTRQTTTKMSDDLSSRSVLVYDHGLFVSVAQKLAESFGRVMYYAPWAEAFPKLEKAVQGDGFPGVERLESWTDGWDADLWVFPDVLDGDLQAWLREQGKRVWGSAAGAALEQSRELFLSTLKEVGLEVPPHKQIRGLSALRSHLREREDCYVKISKWRGTLETTHWRSWALDEGLLDLWGVRLGPTREQVNFIVCEAIPTELELGVDTYCVDGAWPGLCLHGVEAKDKAYFGAVTAQEELPEQLQEVLDRLGPVLAEHGYRNQFSAEVRVAGKHSYCIDATCRGGLPSTASQLELWANFGQIVWEGAGGELVEPTPTGLYSAEVVLSMKDDPSMWTTVALPQELRQWTKLSQCCEVDGLACLPPSELRHGEIGWLVAVGQTPTATLRTLLERGALLPAGVTAHTEGLAEVLKEIEVEEAEGIEFSEQPMPPPEAALADTP